MLRLLGQFLAVSYDILCGCWFGHCHVISGLHLSGDDVALHWACTSKEMMKSGILVLLSN